MRESTSLKKMRHALFSSSAFRIFLYNNFLIKEKKRRIKELNEKIENDICQMFR